MTIKEQIESQANAAKNAAAIQEIIDRLSFNMQASVRSPDRHQAAYKGATVNFTVSGTFYGNKELPVTPDLDSDILNVIIPRLQEFGRQMEYRFAALKPELVTFLEGEIRKLIQPTVTVQSNGVNVEVK